MTFSQNWAKQRYENRIRNLWQKVITTSTPDLWLKIFFYKDQIKYYPLLDESEKINAQQYFNDLTGIWLQHVYPPYRRNRGTYRSAQVFGHGFYDKEWKFIQKHPKIRHCITLKFYDGIKDDSMVQLMAHEYRHYQQYKKYGTLAMNPKHNSDGKRPIQHERDARRWAEMRTKQLGYKTW